MTTVGFLLSAAGVASATTTSSPSSPSIRRGPLVMHIACGMASGTTRTAGDESAVRLNRLPARVAPRRPWRSSLMPSGARGVGDAAPPVGMSDDDAARATTERSAAVRATVEMVPRRPDNGLTR